VKAFALLLVLPFLACGEGPEPRLELGFYVAQRYQPLDEGSHCPVVEGTQGGTWTMPTLRTQGLGPHLAVRCELVTGSGEQVGQVERDVTFSEGSFPIPVRHSEPRGGEPIFDLYGAPATLSCEATGDRLQRAIQAVQVVLVEG
jgi:hypothetical protein